MAQLTDGERKIRLFALVADLERLRREAKTVGCDMLAFLITYAQDEGQKEIERGGPVRPLNEGNHADA